MKLKYPDLDLIRRIQPECGFYGFMIRFWICSQKAKSVFGLGNPDLNFPKKRKLRRMITTTTRNKQHGSKQTNYNLQAWHFEPAEENTRFPRGPLQWVTEAKKSQRSTVFDLWLHVTAMRGNRSEEIAWVKNIFILGVVCKVLNRKTLSSETFRFP